MRRTSDFFSLTHASLPHLRTAPRTKAAASTRVFFEPLNVRFLFVARIFELFSKRNDSFFLKFASACSCKWFRPLGYHESAHWNARPKTRSNTSQRPTAYVTVPQRNSSPLKELPPKASAARRSLEALGVPLSTTMRSLQRLRSGDEMVPRSS